ncbi:hypothetical protein [Holospora elegans]|nr:hypothetical protein [Holospora elegans]
MNPSCLVMGCAPPWQRKSPVSPPHDTHEPDGSLGFDGWYP